MALCGSSEPAAAGCGPGSGQGNAAADHRLKPAPFEIFGQMWSVQARLGQGASACVYRVSGGRGSSAAVKEFQADPHGGDYAYHKEHSVLEDIQGHKNIVTLYGVFPYCRHRDVVTQCLLLELLDVSVSELLGHSLWLVQHCGRDVLEALAFLHREGYVHADLKPRNILWSADDECFKLIDFGLSFKHGNQDVKYIQTDGYRAPEAELQNSLARVGAEGDAGCSSAVDLWSLGIILLEMFSGVKLKDAVSSREWKTNSSAVVEHMFASHSVVSPAIPVYHLRDMIKKMLLVDPKQRCSAEAALLSPFFSVPFAPHIEDLVQLPSPVLRLLNLIDDSHLHHEEEYEGAALRHDVSSLVTPTDGVNELCVSDVLEDMKEECQKYGSVLSLLIPKENPGKGQVFVEFANSSESKEAQRLLTGRTFDGKFVVATFYPLSAYRRGYFYPTLQ
ncbi:unnamed protein product [Lampetra planeri]